VDGSYLSINATISAAIAMKKQGEAVATADERDDERRR
jgi:hypothetical protein